MRGILLILAERLEWGTWITYQKKNGRKITQVSHNWNTRRSAWRCSMFHFYLHLTTLQNNSSKEVCHHWQPSNQSMLAKEKNENERNKRRTVISRPAVQKQLPFVFHSKLISTARSWTRDLWCTRPVFYPLSHLANPVYPWLHLYSTSQRQAHTIYRLPVLASSFPSAIHSPPALNACFQWRRSNVNFTKASKKIPPNPKIPDFAAGNICHASPQRDNSCIWSSDKASLGRVERREQ